MPQLRYSCATTYSDDVRHMGREMSVNIPRDLATASSYSTSACGNGAPHRRRNYAETKGRSRCLRKPARGNCIKLVRGSAHLTPCTLQLRRPAALHPVRPRSPWSGDGHGGAAGTADAKSALLISRGWLRGGCQTDRTRTTYRTGGIWRFLFSVKRAIGGGRRTTRFRLRQAYGVTWRGGEW